MVESKSKLIENIFDNQNIERKQEKEENLKACMLCRSSFEERIKDLNNGLL